jgi:hypothetical protein
LLAMLPFILQQNDQTPLSSKKTVERATIMMILCSPTNISRDQLPHFAHILPLVTLTSLEGG